MSLINTDFYDCDYIHYICCCKYYPKTKTLKFPRNFNTELYKEFFTEEIEKKLATEVGGKAAEFVLPGKGGKAVKLSDFKGKFVLLDFWATWCGPCIREMPRVKTLHEKLHPKGLEIVGVSLDKDPEALAAFLEKNPLPWETLAGDDTQELAGKYAVRAIPTMMLVDREGKIVAVSHSCDQLVPLLEKLLEK